jgi:aminoglycoside phosphotransferase (APT) family kinase protein
MSDALSEKLGHYLAPKFDVDHVAITDLARIPGGASRETYRFRAAYTKDGTPITRALILRRDPPASLIDTDRTTEFRAYHAFFALGLPVPEPIALELSEAVLERPFFIMEEITDCQVGSILVPDPYGALRQSIGEQLFDCLGRIAAADPDKIGLGDLEGARENCWRFEVDRWEREIIEDEREPQVIAHAAIRWLKKNPPPPPQKISVVHGDYRSGNFLYDSKGNIRAILDWEMAHLGDPLEDLAWALDPLWAHGNPAFPAGTIARDEAIARWQAASGLTVDAAAFAWWEMFASLKGLAIWISAAREYCDGRNTDPVNAFSGWYCQVFHNRLLAERLSALES